MPRTTGPRPSPASVHGRQPRGQRPRHTWPEVPDADDFEGLKEAGDPRDATLAKHLHAIHAAGDTRNPTRRYKAFRDRKLSILALLKGRDLISA